MAVALIKTLCMSEICGVPVITPHTWTNRGCKKLDTRAGEGMFSHRFSRYRPVALTMSLAHRSLREPSRPFPRTTSPGSCAGAVEVYTTLPRHGWTEWANPEPSIHGAHAQRPDAASRDGVVPCLASNGTSQGFKTNRTWLRYSRT